jgi:hypothetical protein
MIDINYIVKTSKKIYHAIDKEFTKNPINVDIREEDDCIYTRPENSTEFNRKFRTLASRFTAMKITNHLGKITFSMGPVQEAHGGGQYCMVKNNIWISPHYVCIYRGRGCGYSILDVIVHELTHSMDTSLTPTGEYVQDYLPWELQSCEVLAVSATIAARIISSRLETGDIPIIARIVLDDLAIPWEYYKRYCKLAFRMLRASKYKR